MGMTIAEKILARAAQKDRVRPGEMVVARVDRTRINDSAVSWAHKQIDELGVQQLWDADRVVLVADHHIPPSSVAQAEKYAACRRFARAFGLKHFYDIGQGGICHQVFVERGYARPGELVASSDSHSCTYGALNVAARGVGPTDMLYLLLKGELWFRVPETVRVVLTGAPQARVTSKDIALHIAGKYGTDFGLNRSLEFTGPAVSSLTIDSRLALANMGIELGAKFALFEADDRTLAYLRARVEGPFTPVSADPDAALAGEIEIDVSSLEPQVAMPHDVGNVRPVSAVAGLEIHQAFLGSCTNARLEDLQEAAEILRGRRVHPSVRMIITPASQDVYREALRSGLLEVFMDANCLITNAGCGACIGGSMGVLAADERCISSANRNFQGRMGSSQAEICLASPATVAASAVTGVITDPRKLL